MKSYLMYFFSWKQRWKTWTLLLLLFVRLDVMIVLVWPTWHLIRLHVDPEPEWVVLHRHELLSNPLALNMIACIFHQGTCCLKLTEGHSTRDWQWSVAEIMGKHTHKQTELRPHSEKLFVLLPYNKRTTSKIPCGTSCLWMFSWSVQVFFFFFFFHLTFFHCRVRLSV